MGDIEPSDGTSDGCFEALDDTTTAVHPGECAFDDPLAGQEIEAFGGVGSHGDFDRPFT